MKDTIFQDAEAGDPYACLGVAYYYHHGKEVERDIEEALIWYERAAQAKCPRAHWELARMYRDGEMVLPDLDRYIHHLTEAAELGNVEAQFNLGVELLSEMLLERNPELAFKWIRDAAERGHVFAKFVVGYCYYRGIGVPRSKHDAEIWFSVVSTLGDGDLFLEIGMCYEYGLNGMTRNEMEAGRWYKYGADIGHEKCILCWNAVMTRLSGGTRESMHDRLRRINDTETQKEIRLIKSIVEDADAAMESDELETAFDLYTKAAKMGSPDAVFIVAMMYHQGIHVKRNDTIATELLHRASAAGSEDAQFLLGRMYDIGIIPRDESEAIKQYTKAAVNGFLAAFYYLSRYMNHPEIHVRNSMIR